MVLVLAPAVDKICESFTHNLLTLSQGSTTLLSLMGIQKEYIANESELWGGQYGYACISMGNQKYTLHYHITFLPPRKLVRSPTYPLNPTHGKISVADQKYQNNLHGYHLFKKMNIALNIIVTADINDQWIKGKKYMVMGYANKYFI